MSPGRPAATPDGAKSVTSKALLKGLAERNKMTDEQFAQHLKGMGVDVATMVERFRAQKAGRELRLRKRDELKAELERLEASSK